MQTAAGKTVLLDRSSKCTNQKLKRRLSTAADRIANAPPKLFLVGESKREWSGRLALTVTTRRSLIERLAFFSDDLAYNNEQVNWTSSEYTELYEGSMSVDAPSRDFFRDVINARHDVKIQFPMPLQRICQIDAPSTPVRDARKPKFIWQSPPRVSRRQVQQYNKQQTWKHAKAPRTTPFKLKKIKDEPLKKVKVEPEEMLSL